MPIRNGKFVDWKHTLKIKHLLGDSALDEAAQRAAKEIASVIKTKSFMEDWLYLNEIGDAADSDDLNAMLADLYDYCDANLIWVE